MLALLLLTAGADPAPFVVENRVPPAFTVVDRTAPADPSASVVTVYTGPGAGSGTCVWTDGKQSLVLTNRHVAEAGRGGGWAVTVQTLDGRRFPGRTTFVYSGADLAVCLVDGAIPAARVARDDPAPGTALRHWGSRTGRSEEGPARGRVRGAFRHLTGWDCTGDYKCASGDSGAGLFDDNGELVGVNFAFTGPVDRAGRMANAADLFAPVSYVRDFLAGVPQTKEMFAARGACGCGGHTPCACPAGECGCGPAPEKGARPAPKGGLYCPPGKP